MTTAQNPAQTPEEEAATSPESVVHELSEDAGHDPREEQIALLTAEVAKYKDQWVRTAAEADNIRKRSQREMEETSRYAVTGFARDMVEVLENLTRASSSIPMEKREGNELLKILGEGVDLTLQELLNIFSRYGITRIDPMGQKFDHNFHQAVVQVDRTDIPAGTVVQVVQSGYIIHDRLLRPAMVAVSKLPPEVEKVDTTA